MHKDTAENLNDGFYYVKYATIGKGTFIHNTVIEKIGNQITYIGTDYWDKAEEVIGGFIPIKASKL